MSRAVWGASALAGLPSKRTPVAEEGSPVRAVAQEPGGAKGQVVGFGNMSATWQVKPGKRSGAVKASVSATTRTVRSA